MFDQNPEEHYLKEGDPGKPTYYIIRRMNENTDISTMYRLVMGHVRYALSKGWLPVVDMKNYPNLYLPPEKLGQENAWEYYFEQPLQINLEKAYEGENVILSDGDSVELSPDCSMNFLQKKNDALVEWRMLLKLGLIKMKPELSKEIAAIREKIFSPGGTTLGVLLRAGAPDQKVKGQPIPPPVEFAANTIADKFKEWDCDKIILATNDNSVVETFMYNFGDKCVLLDQISAVCYDTEQDDSDEPASSEDTEDKPTEDADTGNYLQGKKNLMQAVLMCKCNYFVAERCSAATVTMLMAKKFEQTLFFDLGNY